MATKFTDLAADASVQGSDEFLIRNASDGVFAKTTADKLKTFIGASGAWGGITGTLSAQTDLQNELNAKQNALGFTPENVANKQTDLTASATKYPTVDAVIAGIAAIPSVVDASASVKGITKLSTAPASATNPIAVGDNDSRNTDARTPTAHSHPQSDVTNLTTDLSNKADLVGGTVPASQLPSYVDDVLEYANLATFPGTGEDGKIYVAIDTNLTYRWSGSAYVNISQSLALGETSSTAYRGDRGKTAFDHSGIVSGNPHSVTKGDVGLGNVTNESKATMFSNATFTGTFAAAAGSIENAALANGAVANLSGTNTGDNATNSQYSGLAASKQDTLVSATNIKTINSISLLGSGDISISGVKYPINKQWDGQGSAVTTGNTRYFIAPYEMTITGWSIVCTGSSPTCTIDIWKVATGTALPTVSNTIMGTKPALATGNAIRSTTLTGWTTSIAEGDILGFNIDAVSVATTININLEVS